MDATTSQIFNAIGLMGVLFYVSAYAALQAGFIRGNGYTYTILNLIAASLVLVSLTYNFNLSSAVIQTIWIAISVFGLVRHFILHHSTKLTADEAAFARSKLPGIPKPLARRLFLAGTWEDLQPGTVIATEGKELGALVYLLLGEAVVSHGSEKIGQLKSDSFIGELTCFDGGYASATVTVQSTARIFHIGSKNLIKLCGRHPDLRVALEKAIRRDTGMKLIASNGRLSRLSKV